MSEAGRAGSTGASVARADHKCVVKDVWRMHAATLGLSLEGTRARSSHTRIEEN
jgi:hypothetical protein